MSVARRCRARRRLAAVHAAAIHHTRAGVDVVLQARLAVGVVEVKALLGLGSDEGRVFGVVDVWVAVRVPVLLGRVCR